MEILKHAFLWIAQNDLAEFLGLPLILAWVAGAYKVVIKKGNPNLYDYIMKYRNLDSEYRAIGTDLFFAAIGSQLGIVVTRAGDGRAFLDQAILVLIAIIGLALAVVLIVRYFGYEPPPNSGLKEDWGVTFPKYIGFLSLVAVYFFK